MVLAGLAGAGIARGSDAGSARGRPGATAGTTGFAVVERELPELALATERSIGAAMEEQEGVKVRAWGDPARGCFSLGITLRAPGSPGEVEDLSRALLAAPNVTITAPKFSADEHGAAGRFHFQRDDFRGWLATRARPGDGFVDVVAAACFYNQRAPEQCEKLCNNVSERFEAKQ
jgi:hypothetical protein